MILGSRITFKVIIYNQNETCNIFFRPEFCCLGVHSHVFTSHHGERCNKPQVNSPNYILAVGLCHSIE